jgi:hypothetical protein
MYELELDNCWCFVCNLFLCIKMKNNKIKVFTNDKVGIALVRQIIVDQHSSDKWELVVRATKKLSNRCWCWTRQEPAPLQRWFEHWKELQCGHEVSVHRIEGSPWKQKFSDDLIENTFSSVVSIQSGTSRLSIIYSCGIHWPLRHRYWSSSHSFRSSS